MYRSAVFALVVSTATAASAQTPTAQQIKVTQNNTIKLKIDAVKFTPVAQPPTPDSKIIVTSLSKQLKSGPICGGIVNGKPQKRCGLLPAKFQSAARGRCPRGSFFDIGLWQCFTCPAGYRRSAASVSSDRACVKTVKYRRPTYHKAKFVHSYCPSGSFLDPIRGGECWKCPATHPTRTALHIEHWKACKKKFLGPFARAIRVRKAKCDPGTFYDPRHGGQCWKCDPNQVRTLQPVTSSKACKTTAFWDYKEATKVADLTCPSGQIFDLVGLSASDINTRPEFKGTTGQRPVRSGTCWACPPGYDRTMAHVKSDKACRAKTMAWYSAPFPEPGLFGLAGAEEVLLDITKRHPELIRQSIRTVARKAARDNKLISFSEYLKFETKLFRESPERSVAAASAVLVRLMAAISNPGAATKAEIKLRDAFRAHVIAKQKHIANDALAAYDAWYKADKYWKGQRQKGQMSVLFDYGTVPPDFGTLALMNALGAQAQGLAVGALADKMAGAIKKQLLKLGKAAGKIPLISEVIGTVLSSALSGFSDFSRPHVAGETLAKTGLDIAMNRAIGFALKKLAGAAAKAAARQAFAQFTAQTNIALLVSNGLTAGLQAGASGTVSGTVSGGLGAAAANGLSTGASASAMGAGMSATASLAASAGPQIIVTAALIIAQLAIDKFQAIANARPKLLMGVAEAARLDLARKIQNDEGVQELLNHWSFVATNYKKPSWNFTRQFRPAARKIQVTKWRQLGGKGVDIAVGGLATKRKVWAISQEKVSGGHAIVRLDGGKWKKMLGFAERIAVDSNGNAWVVNHNRRISRYDGRRWHGVPGSATDIGIGGAKGETVWVIGAVKRPGGYSIHRRDGNRWTEIRGGAVRIAVDRDGGAWIVNSGGTVYRRVGMQWVAMHGILAKDVGVGANGDVFVVSKKRGRVYTWNGARWSHVGGILSNIAVGPGGKAYGVAPRGELYVWE